MNPDHISTLYPDAQKDEPSIIPAQTVQDEDTSSRQTDTGVKAGEFYDSEVEQSHGNPYTVDRYATEDVLYGNGNRVELADTTDLNVIYSDPTEQGNLRQNLGYMAGEVGLDQAGIETFVNITNDYLLSGEKADPKSTMQQLYQEHGQALHDKLSSAQALIQSLPDLSAYLEQTGLGNHPKFINEVFKASESPRALERLKQLALRGNK